MYIKINLLPREFRPKRHLISLDYKVILFMIIVLAALGLGGYYIYLDRALTKETKKLSHLQSQKAMIKDTVELKFEVDVLKKKITERVAIIKELTNDSDIRFDMLKHINSVIPENLWLLNITENPQGSKVQFTIEGMSYAKKDISKFLEGLENYRKFKSVALESITPSPLETQDAFQFIVKVELFVDRPEAAAKAPAPKPAASAPPKKK
ncbi:MAG: PilN domain-containing protein [Candidatus Latescibacterota bacterium]